MSLGFSVEALLPHARTCGPLRMGLSRVDAREWRDPEPDFAARVRAFADDPEAVRVRRQAEPAIAELAALMGVDGGIDACALAGHEDLCVMVQDQPGAQFHLAAGAVAWPTDWSLEEKIGRSVAEIHVPVPEFAGKIASGVDAFLNGLQSTNLFGRVNAYIVESGAHAYRPKVPMAQRFSHITKDTAGDALFVRCEREVVRRLPTSRAIVFSIGIYTAPLSALSDNAVARLAKEFGQVDPAMRLRRGIDHYEEALRGYAARRAPVSAI